MPPAFSEEDSLEVHSENLRIFFLFIFLLISVIALYQKKHLYYLYKHFQKNVVLRKCSHNASSTLHSHHFLKCKEADSLKKKAKRPPLFITTSPQWGLRFFRTGALLPMTQSKVSTGIFLVKLKAREAGCTLRKVPAPRGLWVGFGGGSGAILKSQMNGPFIWKKGGPGLGNQPPAEDCLWSNPKGEHTHTPARGKDRKGKKGANCD